MAFGNANSPTGERNSINSISVNGKVIEAVNKGVNITVPTKMSQLENDKNYSFTDTTYSLGKEGNDIVLTGSDGKKTRVSDKNDNTTYTLKKENGKIKLVGSDGKTSEVDDDNTTYGEATEEQAGLMPPSMFKSVKEGVGAYTGEVKFTMPYTGDKHVSDYLPMKNSYNLGFKPKLIVFMWESDGINSKYGFFFITGNCTRTFIDNGTDEWVIQIEMTENGFDATLTSMGDRTVTTIAMTATFPYFAIG